MPGQLLQLLMHHTSQPSHFTADMVEGVGPRGMGDRRGLNGKYRGRKNKWTSLTTDTEFNWSYQISK